MKKAPHLKKLQQIKKKYRGFKDIKFDDGLNYNRSESSNKRSKYNDKGSDSNNNGSGSIEKDTDAKHLNRSE